MFTLQKLVIGLNYHLKMFSKCWEEPVGLGMIRMVKVSSSLHRIVYNTTLQF
ncbi:Uncharacterised protein [Mycobacteroides abscessus subsp. abscessus]|nr:Uncharacterised protein [Mycobacteroides abscessus subsp. abscessus]